MSAVTATEPLLLDRTAPDTARPPRATPQSTVEAVMYSLRERGLKALQEPATQDRLRRFDAAARAQINKRIEGLIALGAFQVG